MTYCTQADIENIFGTVNVATWSQLDNDTEDADTARIAEAIEWATSWLDDSFRSGPYKLPLTATAGGTPRQVVDLCARLAGVWLYESRGIDEQDEDGRPFNRLRVHRRYVEEKVRRYLQGRDRMPAVRVEDDGNIPFVVG